MSPKPPLFVGISIPSTSRIRIMFKLLIEILRSGLLAFIVKADWRRMPDSKGFCVLITIITLPFIVAEELIGGNGWGGAIVMPVMTIGACHFFARANGKVMNKRVYALIMDVFLVSSIALCLFPKAMPLVALWTALATSKIHSSHVKAIEDGEFSQ